MFDKPEIKSYDQIEPIRKLYDNIFNDRELFAIEIQEGKFSYLSNKYGQRLDKLVYELSLDLSKACLDLDYKLSRLQTSGGKQE